MKRINMTSQAVRSALRTPPIAGIGKILAALDFGKLWATYNYKGGYFGGTNTGIPSVVSGLNVSSIKLDFAAIAAARVAAGQAALGAADVLELFGVPAGCWVPAVFGQVVTAEGAAFTYDVGDGATPAGFISNADGNVVGWAHSLVTTTYSLATAGGKLYTADDTIDMVIDSANVDVAVVHLSVVMVDVRRQR